LGTPIRCKGKVGLLRRHRLLGNERLGSRSLGLLGCRLLRFWDVGATVLPVINSLACPSRFGGQSVNNLRNGKWTIRIGHLKKRGN
jgi:hypothetical protein